jgi:hypothetical protein
VFHLSLTDAYQLQPLLATWQQRTGEQRAGARSEIAPGREPSQKRHAIVAGVLHGD